MQQRTFNHEVPAQTGTANADESAALTRAIEVIHARQYRQGDRFLAQFSRTIMPLFPDVDYLRRREVDLIALARAIENGLDLELFGKVIEYRDWPVDEFNLFNQRLPTCATINDAMRRFLEHPSHW